MGRLTEIEKTQVRHDVHLILTPKGDDLDVIFKLAEAAFPHESVQCYRFAKWYCLHLDACAAEIIDELDNLWGVTNEECNFMDAVLVRCG